MTTIAQGELFIRRIAAAPEGCTPVEPDGSRWIVGHSETGHHHVLDRATCDVVAGPARANPEGMAILYAIVREPTRLEHLRPTDTHEPLMLAPGVYEIRPGREFSPEGWRRTED